MYLVSSRFHQMIPSHCQEVVCWFSMSSYGPRIKPLAWQGVGSFGAIRRTFCTVKQENPHLTFIIPVRTALGPDDSCHRSVHDVDWVGPKQAGKSVWRRQAYSEIQAPGHDTSFHGKLPRKYHSSALLTALWKGVDLHRSSSG